MRFCSAQCSLALSGGQLGLGGLAAQPRPVVDDFYRHVPGGVIEKDHSGTPWT